MKDMDMFGDICRIEEDKSELLTSVARLFELLTEKDQETGRITEGLSEIVASVFTLGHDPVSYTHLVKARLVKQDGVRVNKPSVELQHDDVPDPFDTEICKLREMMEKDEASVKELLEKIKKQQEKEVVSSNEDIQHNE